MDSIPGNCGKSAKSYSHNIRFLARSSSDRVNRSNPTYFSHVHSGAYPLQAHARARASSGPQPGRRGLCWAAGPPLSWNDSVLVS
ncbi:hypothetical protein CDAR_211731 [Caerostris darwini]|uniref:Uncharacterized protein n=1 Tax=Caerostris darwini TaxID=1538125 RepID=A0AAV4PI61_9ARAC|nr:hypothetical protein CDAR_211731 [Caerostris darwini]